MLITISGNLERIYQSLKKSLSSKNHQALNSKSISMEINNDSYSKENITALNLFSPKQDNSINPVKEIKGIKNYDEGFYIDESIPDEFHDIHQKINLKEIYSGITDLSRRAIHAERDNIINSQTISDLRNTIRNIHSITIMNNHDIYHGNLCCWNLK